VGGRKTHPLLLHAAVTPPNRIFHQTQPQDRFFFMGLITQLKEKNKNSDPRRKNPQKQKTHVQNSKKANWSLINQSETERERERLTREWTKLREREAGEGNVMWEKREGRGSYEGMGMRSA